MVCAKYFGVDVSLVAKVLQTRKRFLYIHAYMYSPGPVFGVCISYKITKPSWTDSWRHSQVPMHARTPVGTVIVR